MKKIKPRKNWHQLGIVWLGGHIYRVFSSRGPIEDDVKTMGMIFYDEKFIVIKDTLDYDTWCSTFIHECIHGRNYYLGYDDVEEEVCAEEYFFYGILKQLGKILKLTNMYKEAQRIRRGKKK